MSGSTRRLLGLVAVCLGACTPPEPVASSSAPSSARPTGAPFIRVLGTAQDGGFPHAACHGEHCRRARSEPATRRAIASLAIVDPAADRVFLIDVTPDIREQLDRLDDVRAPLPDGVDRDPIDALFLTHAHIGHYVGLAFLGFEAVHTDGLPTFTTPRMATFLRSNGPWSQLVELRNLALRPTEPGTPVELTDQVSVEAFPVPHRDELSDTVGYLVSGPDRTVLYVPDTDRWETWNPPLLDRLEGVDVALVDGSFFSLEELPGRDLSSVPHPLMGTTMDLLEERVRGGELTVYFTHLNHSNPAILSDSAEASMVRERGFEVLADGHEIDL